ncbi:glycerophosphodiester phosphodiesterase family protein [Ferruginibacter albus]|uniref:glycerophosphodiester phosphodiesterase family protein n=1 Tax=Ferruginibacter albus TaxID=2875540 RepID=UPI001CC783C3|nr:glycerophosphodiester phosphodiesterase family protein [Ferruginibacter albus]UAY52805.1 glycerophosphodiester phosphodiesterase [Ferruginibacter albus]
MKKIISLLLLVSSCKTLKTNSIVMLPIFDKEGHRGCRGLMPENTIPAMLKALDLGVTTLEMDTHITKDSLVVLSHDAYFNHEITTKPDGTYFTQEEEKNYILYNMPYAEIKKFDVGLKPHPRFLQQQKIAAYKPLLGELIDSVKRYCQLHDRALPFLNIETKCLPETDNIYHPKPDVFVRLLMNVIIAEKIEPYVIIQSFDPRTIQLIHQQYPKIKTALLVEDYDKRSLNEQLKQLGFNPTIYSPDYSLVNENLLQQCHQQNIKVIPWTVNDKNEIKRLKNLGVDGIITDYPNLF